MVHWIYVFKCEDDYIYVGETTRLYRRFTEHLRSKGSINTDRHKPEKLIGLYKVSDNYSFFNYRNIIIKNEYNKYLIEDWGLNEGCGNLEVENHITERYFYERKDNDNYGSGNEWYKVRGGKYTKQSLENIVEGYKNASENKGVSFFARNPIYNINPMNIVDRPLCNHGYLSEVKISMDKKYIYFICSLRNVWDNFYGDIEVESPCNFYKIYDEDIYVKKQYEINNEKIKDPLFLNIPKLMNKYIMDNCVICNKVDYDPVFAYGSRRKLCQHCLSHKYDDIKNKYVIKKDVCLIITD
jgi:hypothetical protein